MVGQCQTWGINCFMWESISEGRKSTVCIKRFLVDSSCRMFVFYKCILLVSFPIEAERGSESMIGPFSHPPIVHCQKLPSAVSLGSIVPSNVPSSLSMPSIVPSSQCPVLRPVAVQHQFISGPPTMEQPLVTVWPKPAPSS